MYSTSQNYKDKVLSDSTQHELNIYIDGNKIEPNHIIDFKQTLELFNNSEFCLGCTPEIDIEFEIDKRDLPETYNEVYIETGVDDEIIPIGHFTIQKPIEDDEFKVKIKATDYMKKFEDSNYDGSDLTYPATMLQVLEDICIKIGVELGSTSFLNSNKQIAVYDNTVSARTYLGYIAEQAGGIAVIGRDGKLYIRQIRQGVVDFDINLFKDYKWGDKFKVSKVSYEDGIQDYKFGDETADTVYIDQNNMYIVGKEQVENIYNQIKDFEIYSFEGETIIDPAYDIGDILVIDGKQVLYQGELNYAGKFKANIKSKIQAKTEQESMQTKENTTTKMRRVQSEIDQANAKITTIVAEQTEQNKKLSQVTQTVDELNSKIQDIADITTFGESMYAKVELDSINESEPIQITVKPTVENISYLYPNSGLYPSETLYPKVRTLRFTNKSLKENEEGKYIDFIFPDDLLIASDGTCDEFYLGYDEQICQVIKRCKYNADGTVSKLDTEQIISYEYPKIQLKDGDYTIELLGYTNAYLGIRLMAQNIYTSQYATKAELSSNITQTKKEVDVSVNEKLINYATTEEMNSTIKVTADSINNEVTKKVNEDELGTKIEQNYEAVKLAWNLISEFIQYEIREGTPALVIKNNLKKILMSLNKTGIHFYDGTEKVIGDIGLIEKDSMKQIAFSVNGTNGANAMVWGVDYNGTFIPVFMYEGYNKESGTEVGGTFYMEAPLLMQGNVLYLGNGTNSPNIVGDDTGNLNITGDNIYLNGATTATEVYSDNYYSNDGDTKSIFSSNVSYIDALWNSESIYISDGANNHFLLTSSSSDKNLKKNIKDVEISALNLIRKIKHKQFDWKSTNNHQNIGYIAQEMQKISENFVHHNVFKDKNGKEEENWQINTLAVLATATKAIQEQQEQIEQLQKEINKLKGEKDG